MSTGADCVCTHARDVHPHDGRCCIHGCDCPGYDGFTPPDDDTGPWW